MIFLSHVHKTVRNRFLSDAVLASFRNRSYGGKYPLQRAYFCLFSIYLENGAFDEQTVWGPNNEKLNSEHIQFYLLHTKNAQFLKNK